jgi:phosphate:Na+ symporter
MGYGFFEFLSLIGALGFFIYGMKVMSEGIQKVAGERLRQILSAMTRNRFLSILTGFLITAIIQSSSATTVMTISFVNAGLLSLSESIGVIMGANVGTTITAWLISIFGFGKISIAALSLPIIAIGVPLIFSPKNQLKSLGEVFIGFSLLFLGLSALKDAVPDFSSSPETLTFLNSYINSGVLSTLLFVGVGTIITLVVQSSSAAMALTLTLLFNGVITFDIAAAMVLGENIGTTVTANIAALVANVHAKRAARAHFVFNAFGALWMILCFPWFIELVDTLWNSFHELLSNTGVAINSTNEELKLALFHSLFNLINLIILSAFIPYIVLLVKKMVPSKGNDDESYKLDYISNSFVQTAELGLLEAKQEVAKFGEFVSEMSGFSKALLLSSDSKKIEQLLQKVKKYEEVTDLMEEEITRYLLKLSTTEISETSSNKIKKILSITHDLEDIGDVYYQMSRDIERKKNLKLWFTPEQRNELVSLYEIIDDAFAEMIANLNNETGKIDIEVARQIEKRINKKRNYIRSEQLSAVQSGESNIKSGTIFNNLLSSAEKIGDYIYNVNETLQQIV